MTVDILPGPRAGCVRIPASKSQAHRLLICAALGQDDCVIRCDGISKDIAATIACLNALGAEIRETEPGVLSVRPIREVPTGPCILPCGESGSTLRFLLPVVGALGAEAVFRREGRLPQRPLAPLDAELSAHGMSLKEDGARLLCSGRLRPGDWSLPGNVSSQYISGLLMALPHINGESRLSVSGKLESAAYVTMTEDALRLSGLRFEKEELRYRIPGGQRGGLSGETRVLLDSSSQGDRAVWELLLGFGAEGCVTGDGHLIRRGTLCALTIDAAPIPDLIPVLSVVASVAEGETHIVNAGRLRLKESDRLMSTTRMLKSLGADITELPDGLVIRGKRQLAGGTVDAMGDHRIAMSAAAAACVCAEPVTVLGSECVEKSYPRFWQDYEQLWRQSP